VKVLEFELSLFYLTPAMVTDAVCWDLFLGVVLVSRCEDRYHVRIDAITDVIDTSYKFFTDI